MEENKELAASPVLLPENSTPQKYFLTRNEWYEVQATATYEVMANSHEEAVSKVERFDEIGGQPDCQLLNISCDNADEALEELPLETDEDAVVILEADIFRPEHGAKSAAARTKKLPIKPYYSGHSYKAHQEPEKCDEESEEDEEQRVWFVYQFQDNCTDTLDLMVFYHTEAEATAAAARMYDRNGRATWINSRTINNRKPAESEAAV